MKVGEKYSILKSFPGKMDRLHLMLKFVMDYGKIVGFQTHQLLKIELALEEALVNIISYGYADKEGAIEITCGTLEKGMRIILRDQGVAFNPLENMKDPKPDEPGGYGLFFIRNIMDKIEYEREGDTNVLRMEKYK